MAFIEDIVIQIGEEGRLPSQGTLDSAGSDLYAAEDVILRPEEKKLIPTDLRIQMPEHLMCLILPRSGRSLKTHFRVANAPGLIDPDYRGELGVIGWNACTTHQIIIRKGEKIAQVVFVPFIRPNWVVSEKLDATERGEQGFGHTGN